MKKENDKLKENLVNSSFSVKGECAISLLLTKLDIINIELSMELGRRAIQLRTGRMKSYESTSLKMKKKGLERNFSNALEYINDLIGVRAICSYVDDIYRIADIISEQKDIRIVEIKDYIKDPKKSGYSSLHIILEIPIGFQDGTQWMKSELQLRTAAMDYWANLDHQLRYKRGRKEAELIDTELRACADVIENLDRRMLEIRKKIDKI